MKYSIPVDENHPAYGYIFEVDILQDLLDIGWHEDYWSNTNTTTLTNSVLPLKETRSVKSLNDLSDPVTGHLFSSIFTYDNIVKMISSNDHTYKRFLRLYPFREKYDLNSFCRHFFTVAATVVFDQNTYYMHRHVDNRLVFGNFIINLRDNDNSTKFYDGIRTVESYYSAPTEKGKGVFFLNTEETVHNIIVESDKERSIMIVDLSVRT